MVGREVEPPAVARGRAHARRGLPDARGLTARGDRGVDALRDVSLDVRRGEIVGIAGVAGNGQRELAEVVTGMRPLAAGSIAVDGQALRPGDPRAAIRAGIAHVPEDRLHTGVAPSLSIASNVVLKAYREPDVSAGPLLRLRRIRDRALALVQRYDVRMSGVGTPARKLSGGNLQKVVLGREFTGEPRVLVVAAPTRGLDVGAIETVHAYLREAADGGAAILLISEDLDEVRALSDRIAVMYEGAIVGEVDAATAPVEELGLLMAGTIGERRVRIEKRLVERRWLLVAVPIGSLVVAHLAIALVLVATGHSPLDRRSGGSSTPPISTTARSRPPSSRRRRSRSRALPRRSRSGCGSSTSAARASSTSARSAPQAPRSSSAVSRRRSSSSR